MVRKQHIVSAKVERLDPLVCRAVSRRLGRHPRVVALKLRHYPRLVARIFAHAERSLVVLSDVFDELLIQDRVAEVVLDRRLFLLLLDLVDRKDSIAANVLQEALFCVLLCWNTLTLLDSLLPDLLFMLARHLPHLVLEVLNDQAATLRQTSPAKVLRDSTHGRVALVTFHFFDAW